LGQKFQKFFSQPTILIIKTDNVVRLIQQQHEQHDDEKKLLQEKDNDIASIVATFDFKNTIATS